MSLDLIFYGEISCPWCLIALHWFDNVLARDFSGQSINVRHEPVILTEGLPKEGIALADTFRQKHGSIDPSAAYTRPKAEARSAGLTLSLAHQPRIFDMTAVHTVIRLAPAASQHALAVAVTDARFLHGVEMRDLATVAEIASRHGFAPTEALAALHDPTELRTTTKASQESRRRGVSSVPLIVFPDGHKPPDGFGSRPCVGYLEQDRTSERARGCLFLSRPDRKRTDKNPPMSDVRELGRGNLRYVELGAARAYPNSRIWQMRA